MDLTSRLAIPGNSSSRPHPTAAQPGPEASSSDGVYWGDKTILPDGGFGSPALATANERLEIAWTGTDTDHHINVASSPDGVNSSRHVTLPETSNAGPALATLSGGGVELAWAGSGKMPRLNVAMSNDGLNFTHTVTLPDTTRPETTAPPGRAMSTALITFAEPPASANAQWSTDRNAAILDIELLDPSLGPVGRYDRQRMGCIAGLAGIGYLWRRRRRALAA